MARGKIDDFMNLGKDLQKIGDLNLDQQKSGNIFLVKNKTAPKGTWHSVQS